MAGVERREHGAQRAQNDDKFAAAEHHSATLSNCSESAIWGAIL
jgi:hypothetical protein